MISAAVDQIDFATDALPGAELHALLAELRERGRVVRVRFRAGPALLVTRFEDLREAFRDDQSFPGGDMYVRITEPVVGRTFISMNGREHDQHRRLAAPAFSSRLVAQFDENHLTPLAHSVVDRFAARGHADLVSEFTSVLPFYAITRKLGVPRTSDDRMCRWADRMLSYPTDPAGALAAAGEFTSELAPLVAERRRLPGEDLLSVLAHAQVDGEGLGDEELLSTIRLLFAVGATTTSHAMGNLLWTLLERPQLLERARSEPDLRPAIVQELLRWEGPLGVLPTRIATHDTTFAGTAVPRGTTILFGIAAANRDPRAFDEPNLFAPERAAPEILTFGFGNKFCPGSHLARRELLTALDVLLERLPGLRLADRGGSIPAGGVLRHPNALQVTWDAPAAARRGAV